MSDNEYTPTEDDLRDGWMRACYYLDDGPDNDGSGAYRSGGPRFDRALARIKAEAWDEGYKAGVTDQDGYDPRHPSMSTEETRNPYRADRIEQGGQG